MHPTRCILFLVNMRLYCYQCDSSHLTIHYLLMLSSVCSNGKSGSFRYDFNRLKWHTLLPKVPLFDAEGDVRSTRRWRFSLAHTAVYDIFSFIMDSRTVDSTYLKNISRTRARVRVEVYRNLLSTVLLSIPCLSSLLISTFILQRY